MNDEDFDKAKEDQERYAKEHEFNQEARELSMIYWNHCDIEELLWSIEVGIQILRRRLILHGAKTLPGNYEKPAQ